MADGACWLTGVENPIVQVQNVTCHAAVMRFLFTTGAESTHYVGNKLIPHPDRPKQFTVGMRGGFDAFSQRGPVQMEQNELYGTGDDAIGLVGQALAIPTRTSDTTFTAWSNGHYFNTTAKVGDVVILYDTSDYSVVDTGVITAVSAVTVETYLAEYTVSMVGGALPADLTGHEFGLSRATMVALVQHNRITNIRGRGVWGNMPGMYDNNTISYTTNQAIALHPQAGGGIGATRHLDVAERISASRNIIDRACEDGFYPAAIQIFGAATQYEASADKPLRSVRVDGNSIMNSRQYAIILGGIASGTCNDNFIDGANSASEYGEEVEYMGSNKGAIGLINCDIQCKRNTGRSLNSGDLIVTATVGGGSNDIEYDDNRDLDAGIGSYRSEPFGIGAEPPSGVRSYVYESGAPAIHRIQASSTFTSRLEMLNDSWHVRLSAGGSGLTIYDVTADAGRWTWDTSGHMLPVATTTYDIGSTGARARVIYSNNANFSGAQITMSGLPTSNPAVAGRLWNDGGTVKVSAG